METPFIALTEVARVLEELNITYVVVGSFASSMHGLYRATADVNIVADINSNQVAPLVAALQENFYVDEQAVGKAVIQHRSFNAIHFDSVFKIDIFIPSESDFSRQQLRRRRLENISADTSQGIYVATAEDTILAKLNRYRAGGEVSNTQWSDVLGIIGTQGGALDIKYLRKWADKCEVRDLLEQALAKLL